MDPDANERPSTSSDGELASATGSFCEHLHRRTQCLCAAQTTSRAIDAIACQQGLNESRSAAGTALQGQDGPGARVLARMVSIA